MDELLEPVLSDRFQSRAVTWLRIFSAVCLLSAAVLPLLGEAEFHIAMVLPFAHCGLFWAVLVVRSLPNPWMNTSSLYIKERHPVIWGMLHPWGDYSQNGLASISFLSGKLDDGTDPFLNLIKQRMRTQVKLFAWPFFLIPAVWLVALPVRIIFGKCLQST